MEHRNRASGWKHAKLSGHENEVLVEQLIINNDEYQKYFLDRIGKSSSKIVDIDIGGIREKNVDCVFAGEKTKSKTDMHIILDDGSHINVSIKKSLGGQVYLISAPRFIDGFEFQYNTIIPDIVKRAIYLYWGAASDTLDLIYKYGTHIPYETHKNRLVADSLKRYDISLYTALLDWFTENTYEIADFCFSKGLAINSDDWADVIWYKNELGENKVDEVFVISDLCQKLQNNAIYSTEYRAYRSVVLLFN